MTTSIQRSGSRGEVSPDFWARADIAPWHSAFKTLRNWYVKKQGNEENRGGLEFVGEFLSSSAPGVLQTFRYGATQQYILEFTNQLLRFIYQGQYVSDSSGIVTAIQNASNPAITVGLGGGPNNFVWNVGDSGYFTGVTGPIAQYLNNRLFIISAWNGLDPGTLKLTTPDGQILDSTNWGALGGLATFNHIYELATPYLTADLPYLKFGQSGGLMKIRNRNYQRYKLLFISQTQWSLVLDTGWPDQIPAVNTLQSTAGNEGAIPYNYKVSCLNLATGEESFPGSIYGGSGGQSTLATFINTTTLEAALTGVNGSNVYNFNIPGHGLSTGQKIFTNNNAIAFGNPPSFTGTVMLPGPQYEYQITKVDNDNFTVVGYSNFVGGQQFFLPGGYHYPLILYTTSIPTLQQISAINTGSSPNTPVQITTAAAHGMSSGNEVVVKNSGVFGLDNNTFIIEKIDATNFYLNGTQANNYEAWVSGGYVTPTFFSIGCAAPTQGNPNNLTWAIDAAQGSLSTNPLLFIIYLSIAGGPYGFIGESYTTSFSDTGIEPSEAQTPLTYNPIFLGTGNYPGAMVFYRQRDVELSTANNPQFFAASIIDLYDNFGVHDPLVASDGINTTIATNEMTEIFDAIDMGYLVLMTDVCPIMCLGDSSNSNSLTPLPGGIGAANQAYPGAAQIPGPLFANKNILYVLKDGSTIYSLKVLQTLWGSYIGDYDDLSLLSFHLLNGDQVVRWAYQETPHKIFWVVMASGKILSLTYDDKTQVVGWGRHDTQGGFAESVAVAQEGQESVVYFVIRRTINGETKRYVERLCLHDQGLNDVRYYNFYDSSAIYDGTQWAGAQVGITFTNSGGDFSYDDPAVIATAGSAIFTSSMVGMALQFPNILDAEGNPLYFNIIGYTSSTVVQVEPSAQVAPAQQGVALLGSVLAIQTVYGLWNLEGQAVSVLGDGFEAANALMDPNPLVVTNGAITLEQPYGVITVGLPITADVGTLPYDDSQGETQVDKKKMANKVNLGVSYTRGLFIGPEFPDLNQPPTQGMTELKLRTVDQGYDEPTDLSTGFIQEIINGAWRFAGEICIRQVSGVPATITSIAPSWADD